MAGEHESCRTNLPIWTPQETTSVYAKKKILDLSQMRQTLTHENDILQSLYMSKRRQPCDGEA